MSKMKSVDFMDFWQAMNDVLKSRGLDELRFGDAKGFWHQLPDSDVSGSWTERNVWNGARRPEVVS